MAVVNVVELLAESGESWEDAVRQAMADPVLVRRMAEGGLTPRFEDAKTLAGRLEADRRQWREVIRSVNLRAE